MDRRAVSGWQFAGGDWPENTTVAAMEFFPKETKKGRSFAEPAFAERLLT